MATIVIDPRAWLPVRVDRDVVYARSSWEALVLLRARRASATPTGTVWLSWDLGGEPDQGGDDASTVVAALTRAARQGRPYPIGEIVVHTHNSERCNQMTDALAPWYSVGTIAPSDSVLYTRGRPVRQPRAGLTAVDRLRRAGVRVEAGLSDVEVDVVERRFGFTFCPPHRALLQDGLPVDRLPVDVGSSARWPDWRHGNPADLSLRIQRPWRNAVLTRRPRPGEQDTWLIPLFGNRFLPSGIRHERSPVFSAHENDVIYYGADLAGWIGSEFEAVGWSSPPRPAIEDRVPFWSDIAEGLHRGP